MRTLQRKGKRFPGGFEVTNESVHPLQYGDPVSLLMTRQNYNERGQQKTTLPIKHPTAVAKQRR
jgi:hypothetical protein